MNPLNRHHFHLITIIAVYAQNVDLIWILPFVYFQSWISALEILTKYDRYCYWFIANYEYKFNRMFTQKKAWLMSECKGDVWCSGTFNERACTATSLFLRCVLWILRFMTIFFLVFYSLKILNKILAGTPK